MNMDDARSYFESYLSLPCQMGGAARAAREVLALLDLPAPDVVRAIIAKQAETAGLLHSWLGVWEREAARYHMERLFVFSQFFVYWFAAER